MRQYLSNKALSAFAVPNIRLELARETGSIRNVNPSVNHDYLHELAQQILTTGQPKSMSYHLWKANACPALFDSQAAVELGEWSRDYGIEVKHVAEMMNTGPRVMLHFS